MHHVGEGQRTTLDSAFQTQAVPASLNIVLGITSPLWPIRYKPLPDELLSCWLVRLAHGHGLKVQTFSNLIFGNRRQVWNRDIDRLAPEWLVGELSRRTGTPLDAVWDTTLRAYEGVLYRRFRSSGVLHGILSLKMYHRMRQGFGLQFCPICLASDPIPYFRKAWRVAFVTVCGRHGVRLLDRCPTCGTAIAIHRLDMVRSEAIESVQLSYCYACGFDLREGQAQMPTVYDQHASELLLDARSMLDDEGRYDGVWELTRFEVMRHLCNLMTSRRKHVHLRKFVLERLGVQDVPIAQGKISFEARPVTERHHLIQLAAWLLSDLEPRLECSWREGAVRYNVFLKDFFDPPDWYTKITKRFLNWRSRS